MADHPGNDPVDKALRLFVYGPLGFAAYVRDSAPTFLEVFVSRGRREVQGARRAIEGRLGLGAPVPPPTPPLPQRVADHLGRVVAQAGGVVSAVATGARSPGDAAGAATTVPHAASNGRSADPADLPIAGYDLLSATQVIERLDGLSRGALERIRNYEVAHRARRTILAAIDQLTG